MRDQTKEGRQMFWGAMVFFAIAAMLAIGPLVAKTVLNSFGLGDDHMNDIAWAYAYMFLGLPVAAICALIGTLLSLASAQRLGHREQSPAGQNTGS